MANYLRVEFLDEAAEGIHQLAKITNRTCVEVVCDALSIYEWILQQQTLDRAVVSLNSGSEHEEVELEHFVRDKDAARLLLFQQT